MKFFTKNKKLKIMFLLVLLLILIQTIYFLLKFMAVQREHAMQASYTCRTHMIYCSLGLREAEALKSSKTVDYSNEYWWVDVLNWQENVLNVLKNDLNPELIHEFCYCPLDKSRKHPSSYKINPNLRLSDLTLSSDFPTFEGSPSKDRVLIFYEDKDYHKRGYKFCFFDNEQTDFLTDQEIDECIKSTRERIKRVKSEW